MSLSHLHGLRSLERYKTVNVESEMMCKETVVAYLQYHKVTFVWDLRDTIT
jgi:hypothetical protein